MIYIIDTGFGDNYLTYGNTVLGTHGANQLAVIQKINPTAPIRMCDLGPTPSAKDILDVLNFVNETARDDAVLCISFSMPYHEEIDEMITFLSSRFRILVAGGNAQQLLSDLTPCSNDSVITVGSLNKSKIRASHNSIGDLDLVAPGTNIDVNGVKISGTSIATAIATGYFSKHNSVEATQSAILENFEYIITCKF